MTPGPEDCVHLIDGLLLGQSPRLTPTWLQRKHEGHVNVLCRSTCRVMHRRRDMRWSLPPAWHAVGVQLLLVAAQDTKCPVQQSVG